MEMIFKIRIQSDQIPHRPPQSCNIPTAVIYRNDSFFSFLFEIKCSTLIDMSTGINIIIYYIIVIEYLFLINNNFEEFVLIS